MQTTPRRADATPTELPAPSPFFRYRFANVEFDESLGTVSVAGVPVDIEPRPRELLSELLRRPNEVIAREELLEALWQGRPTVDNVLANAVTKLRKALGPEGAERLLNVPRVGYRLAGPIERVAVGHHAGDLPLLNVGELVPGRLAYRLEAPLGRGAATALVWRARDPRLQETRVFKFAADGERLTALKREYTLYRVLRAELGERDDFARVLGANFATAPYFIECEDGGPDLLAWADEGDRLANLSTGERLSLFLKVARAVAAAHGVGVLHKDLKPANVLVTSDANGLSAKLTDFGSSRLLEPGRLAALGVTAMGLTVTQGASFDFPGGTPLYLAPELIAGRSPTTQSDLYALGLMLYQLLAGDLRRPMSTGWQREIDDALLAEDIAAATEGRTADRMGSVAELVERLETLETRRAAAIQVAEAARRADALSADADRRRARRPWVVGALVALSIGLATSLWFYRRASTALEFAQQESARANSINDFLHRDVLESPDVTTIGPVKPLTMLKVLRRARDAAAMRFADQPRTEARLQRKMAETFLKMSSEVDAAVALKRTIALLTPTAARDEPDLAIAHFLSALVDSHDENWQLALEEIDKGERIAGPSTLSSTNEVAYWDARARHTYLFDTEKYGEALPFAVRAMALGDALKASEIPDRGDDRLRLAETYFKLGDTGHADPLIAQLEAPLFGLRGVRDLFNAKISDNRAERYIEQRRWPDVERELLAERALLLASGTPSDYKIALVNHQLAGAYLYRGKNELALATFEDLVKTFERILGPEHGYYHSERVEVAGVLVRLGRSVEAVQLYEEEKRWWLAYQPTSNLVQLIDFGLGSALIGAGRAREALELLKRVDLKKLEATTNEKDTPARLEAEIGRALIASGSAAEGFPRLRKAIAALRALQSTPGMFAWYEGELRRLEAEHPAVRTKRESRS